MMVGPAVADTRIIPAFVSSAGVDQPLTRTLHGPQEEQWAGIYVIAGVQPVWTSGMVEGVVLVGPAARSHASRACVRRWPVLWGQSAYAFYDAVLVLPDSRCRAGSEPLLRLQCLLRLRCPSFRDAHACPNHMPVSAGMCECAPWRRDDSVWTVCVGRGACA